MRSKHGGGYEQVGEGFLLVKGEERRVNRALDWGKVYEKQTEQNMGVDQEVSPLFLFYQQLQGCNKTGYNVKSPHMRLRRLDEGDGGGGRSNGVRDCV